MDKRELEWQREEGIGGGGERESSGEGGGEKRGGKGGERGRKVKKEKKGGKNTSEGRRVRGDEGVCRGEGEQWVGKRIRKRRRK